MITLHLRKNYHRGKILYRSIKTAHGYTKLCFTTSTSIDVFNIFLFFLCNFMFFLRDDMCMNGFSLVFQLEGKMKEAYICITNK